MENNANDRFSGRSVFSGSRSFSLRPQRWIRTHHRDRPIRGKVTDIDGKDDTDRDDQILQYVKIIELLILN